MHSMVSELAGILIISYIPYVLSM